MKRLGILVLVFLVSTAVPILANEFEQLVPGWRHQMAAIWGIVFGTILLLAYRFLISRLGVRAFKILSSFKDITIAIALTLFVFCVAIIFLRSEWQGIQEIESSMLVKNFFYQIRPAYVEEVGFRYGLANLAYGFFGTSAALFFGAVPFGVMHLLNFISGQPIQWDYIIGVSLGGLFLTLVFMNFNLVASILVHFAWNFLAFFCSRIFGLPQERLEGAPITLVLLLLVSLYLLWRLKRMNSLPNGGGISRSLPQRK